MTMRLLACLVPLLGLLSGSAASSAPTDFRADVEPILKAKCTPCHFSGGKMYASLPFDRPETVVRLGERLFTRIKAKDEQAVIRRFLQEQKR